MTERVTDLNYLERQLQEVEGRLQQVVGLLNTLKTVQGKFKDLATYYQDTKAHIDEARHTLAQMEQDHTRAMTLLDEELTHVMDAQETFSQAHLQQVSRHDDAHRKGLDRHPQAISFLQGRYEEVQGEYERQFQDVRDTAQHQLVDLGSQLNEQLRQLAEQRAQLDVDAQAATRQVSEKAASVHQELTDGFDSQRRTLNEEYGGFATGMREEFSQTVENIQFTQRELKAEVSKQVTELRTAVASLEKRLYQSEEKQLSRLTPISTEVSQLNRKHESLQAELAGSQQTVAELQAKQKTMNTLLMIMAFVAVVALILSLVR
jgi:DNA repair exonuclease SbcCD ATPase subunit